MVAGPIRYVLHGLATTHKHK